MSTVNLILQTLHNLGRWLLLIAALVAILRAIIGWIRQQDFTRADERVGLIFTILMDIQVLLGLILFFSKGWAGVLVSDPSTAMSTEAIRFFAVEHLVVMLLALAAAHIGRARTRKAAAATVKHTSAAFWYLVALLLVLVAVPWPFYSSGRPLLRLFGITL